MDNSIQFTLSKTLESGLKVYFRGSYERVMSDTGQLVLIPKASPFLEEAYLMNVWEAFKDATYFNKHRAGFKRWKIEAVEVNPQPYGVSA